MKGTKKQKLGHSGFVATAFATSNCSIPVTTDIAFAENYFSVVNCHELQRESVLEWLCGRITKEL